MDRSTAQNSQGHAGSPHAPGSRRPRPPSYATVIGVLLLIAVGCVLQAGIAAYHHSALNPDAHRQDWGFAAAERRLAPVRPEIAGERAVGYVTDSPNTDPSNARYVMAQRLLAPTLLDARGEHALILIDADDDAGLDRLADERSLVIVRRLGVGLALAERRGRP